MYFCTAIWQFKLKTDVLDIFGVEIQYIEWQIYANRYVFFEILMQYISRIVTTAETWIGQPLDVRKHQLQESFETNQAV